MQRVQFPKVPYEISRQRGLSFMYIRFHSYIIIEYIEDSEYDCYHQWNFLSMTIALVQSEHQNSATFFFFLSNQTSNYISVF